MFRKFPKVRKAKDANIHRQRQEIPGPVSYFATVKVHGTNAAVGKNEDGELFYQSRNRIITLEEDNQGFVRWFTSEPRRVAAMAKFLDPGDILYGEFAGEGIQQKVATSSVDKFFMPFVLWAADEDVFDPIKDFRSTVPGLVSPWMFAKIDLDFTSTDDMRFMEEVTLEVEDCCPIGERLGEEGIGEGLVWYPADPELSCIPELWFKTKGDKHAKTAKKSSFKPQPDRTKATAYFKEQFAVRAFQGLQYIEEMHGEATKKQTGDFIQWTVKDILDEEELPEGVTEHDLGKVAGGIAAPWYLEQV